MGIVRTAFVRGEESKRLRQHLGKADGERIKLKALLDKATTEKRRASEGVKDVSRTSRAVRGRPFCILVFSHNELYIPLSNPIVVGHESRPYTQCCAHIPMGYNKRAASV